MGRFPGVENFLVSMSLGLDDSRHLFRGRQAAEGGGGHRNGGEKGKTEEQEHPNYWWDEWNWSGFLIAAMSACRSSKLCPELSRAGPNRNAVCGHRYGGRCPSLAFPAVSNLR